MTDRDGNRKVVNVPRVVFFVTTAFVTVLGAFLAGIYSAMHETAAYRLVGTVYLAIKKSVAALGETAILRPEPFLQPARNAGAGVTVNMLPDDGGLILLAGFFEDGNELRLIRRDGSVVRRWPVTHGELFPDAGFMKVPEAPATDWNIDLHGSIALPDGSVVFNFEYGGLVRLDRCGKVEWTLDRPTHHSVERAEGGGFWVPGRRMYEGTDMIYPPFEPPYAEDLIFRVSDDGRIVREISVPNLFYRNPDATAVLTATGERFVKGQQWDHEPVHLNKITELSTGLAARFPMFRAGDLLLSLREQNLLFVVDPETETLKWWQTGPWLRQHDPEFTSDGHISVFNNNAWRTQLKGEKSDLSRPRVSNILSIDPASRSVRKLYGGAGQELYTVLRGKQHEVPNGGLLITEFEAGRVFEIDSEGRVVWEYINRFDDANVAEITEARYYPPAYFKVADWRCDDGSD